LINFWWTPILLITSVLAAYFSWKSNDTGNIKWAISVWALNTLPLWAVISYYSNNLLMDGLVYDIVLTIAYTAAIIYFSTGQVSFSTVQWICVGVMLISFVVFKIYTK